MGKMETPRKIRVEDFGEDDKSLVEKLSYPINNFMDNVYNTLNNGVDYSNLRREMINVTVTTNSTGKLIGDPQFKIQGFGRLAGSICINAYNINSPLVYPIATPFLSLAANGNLVRILSVTGLQVSSQYRLTLEVIMV